MRELMIRKLLKLAVEILGVKRKWRFVVRRMGESPRVAPALAVT